MFRKICMHTVVILLGLSACLAGRSQSLDDYLEMASRNNSGLKAAYSDYYAAVERTAQVGVLPDPQLSFGFFILPVETRLGPQFGNLGLRQMLPWFGERAAMKDVVTEQAKVYFAEFERQKNQLHFKVRKAYYRMYQLEKDIRKMEGTLELLVSFEALALKKYEAGLADMVNILRVQLSRNELKAKLAKLEDQREVQQSAFNALLNRMPQEDVIVPDILVESKADLSGIRDSLGQHPAFRIMDVKTTVLERQSRLVDLQGKPDFSVGLNYLFVGQRTDMNVAKNGRDAIMPSFGLSIPLHRKQYHARQRELALRQKGIDARREAKLDALSADFDAVLAALRDAERRKVLYREQLLTTEQALNLLIAQFAAAGKDIEDVLKMQVRRLDYELALSRAQTDHLIQYAKIRELTGN